jgi:arylformamidase
MASSQSGDAQDDDLSDAYANAPHIPGGAEFPARWAAASAAFRAARRPETLAYGPHPREALDLYRPPGRPEGLAVIVHGGYWMAFSPADFSHLAAGALARGWAVAMPGYPLCPEARIRDIVASLARAVDRAAAAVEGPVTLSGHSAGGHAAARLACPDVPLACRARIARAVPVSPLGDLRPLMRTAMNATLRLDAAEAAAESPALRPAPPVPVTVWVGAAERPAFVEQARTLAAAWDADLVEEPARHHFDVIAGYEDPGHPLARALTGG